VHSSELEQRYDFRPRKDSQDTIRGLNTERTDIPWKTPITARGPEHKRFFLQIKKAKHNEVLQILQMAKLSGCLSVVLFDVAMRKFADKGRFRDALQVYRMMRENSHEPEPRNLKLIFAILRKLELNSEIIALFESMESKDRAPEHFTGALEAFAHSTRLSELCSLYESYDFPFHMMFYSELMRVYSLTGDLKSGLKLFGRLLEEAPEKIYDHSTAFMNNLFVLIKKHGTVSLARKIFHNIPNPLSVRTLNTYLSILVKEGNLAEIESIIETMGENTDQITMGILSNAYAMNGAYEKSQNILTKYDSPVMLATLIRYMIERGEFDLVNSTLSRFQHLKKDEGLFQSTFEAFYKAGELGRLDAYYNSLGPEIVPYIAEDSDSGAHWDVHRWQIGTALACIRHGLRSTKTLPNTTIVVTGHGRHLTYTKGNRGALKEHLTRNSHLLGDFVVRPGNGKYIGCVFITKSE